LGTIQADGTEQTVFETSETGEFSGYVDLANMVGGNTTTIRVYFKVKGGGTYRKFDEVAYSGVQSKPAIHIPPLQGAYGFKVTLQQSAPTYQTYDYCFFKR
jgi:hypothetical protein